ncbi:MAG: class I SAM-dependent methyltransferase [Ardenticatenaceae bacterium]|nr:class I SAM-dependent methyltransferase [Anaerolineales bacterium]MCB8982927.1 class I SAM-dependent methyltransferase [Ardenticatenaceae bacterium]MCB8986385.1 class I SAM-dependent methyltransferase [Ardenticatenaceae bacterium]
MITFTPSFARYLAAKKSVDDRALNAHVWRSMAQAVTAMGGAHVLEVGAGIGTMVERWHERGLWPPVSYTAVDANPENVAAAQERLAPLKEQAQLTVTAVDLYDFIAQIEGRQTWDVLLAHAFLDLVDVPTALPALFSLLRAGGLFYFTLNFDGATILQPTIDPLFDARIEALYHRTMDERRVNGRASGDSQTGRHLFTELRHAGGEILAAGSSDWVVFAGADGYPDDEAYFLHFIVNTMHEALSGHPELDKDYFNAWIAHRHAQIESGDLVYVAHQLDFLGRKL